MSKVDTLNPVANLSTGSAIVTINDNYDKIEEAFENTLSRDGSTPNQMNADIDMNGNSILNVGSLEVVATSLDVDQLTVGGQNINDLVDIAVDAAAEAEMWADVAQGSAIPPNTITAAMLQTDSVTTVKIANSNVTTAKIADGNVTTVKLANDTVTFGKMQDITSGNLIGRLSGGVGDPEQISSSQLWNFMPTGSVIDSTSTRTNVRSNYTSVIPNDNTIPQVTEGTEVFTLTLTPKSVTNKFRVRTNFVMASQSVPNAHTWAFFVNGAANCSQCNVEVIESANYQMKISDEFEFTPGVTTPVTVSLRIGSAGGTWNFCGNGADNRGGTMYSSMILEEIKA